MEGYVLQVDGIMVMEKDKPVLGKCEGREVKQVVLHPLENSGQGKRTKFCVSGVICLSKGSFRAS